MTGPLYSHDGTDYYEGDRVAYGSANDLRWGIVAPRPGYGTAEVGILWARFNGADRGPTYIEITKVVRHEPAARTGHDDSVQ